MDELILNEAVTVTNAYSFNVRQILSTTEGEYLMNVVKGYYGVRMRVSGFHILQFCSSPKKKEY